MERYFFSVTTEHGEIWDPAGIPFLFPSDALAFGKTLALRVAARQLQDGAVKTVTVRSKGCAALATFTVGEKPAKRRAPPPPRPIPRGRKAIRLADLPKGPR